LPGAYIAEDPYSREPPARAASGVIEENVIAEHVCGVCTQAGNKSSPASYSILTNRVANNNSEGISIGGSSVDGTDPALLPVSPGTVFDSATALINGNDVSDNNKIPFITTAISLAVTLPNIPARQVAGNISAIVTNNTIRNNALGVAIDAAFPFRNDPRLWTGNVRASFIGNSISGSKSAPVLITFTRTTAATQPSDPKYWKYLQDSTFTISDPNGDLLGHCVETARQYATIQRVLDRGNPVVVEVVKNARLNAGPVVDRHGEASSGRLYLKMKTSRVGV
jgi:hypothetical protein